jgi:hypothetical protein
MKYDFNGKILNIPDKDLELLEKNLEISKEEAIQCWLDDNDYTVSEEEQELTKKAKAIRHYEKSDKERKKVTKERKVDEEKKRFLDGFRIYVEGCGGVVTNFKNEAEFSYNFGGNEYTVKLIKHRPPKAK